MCYLNGSYLFAGSNTAEWTAERLAIASTGAALPWTPSFSMLTMTDTEIVPERVQDVKDLIVQCEYTVVFLSPLVTNEPRHEKTNVLVSDYVRHKQGCTATENG